MAKQEPIPRLSRIFRMSGRVLRLLIAYSIIWVALTGADPASWIIGGPMVVFAVAATILLHRDALFAVNPAGVCLFVPYFILQSFLSAIDVLRRTFSPRLPINPGMISYETFLPEGGARILFANTISLLPGTLSADLRNGEIVIHALDTDLPVWTNLQKLEVSIARIFLRPSAAEKQP
jgi:multicomponent Na+:H+ antiporter subunit E